MSAVSQPGSTLDRLTQAWVKTTGRRVDLADHPWLRGPVGSPDRIGDAWIANEASRLGGDAHPGGGLLASMDQLAGDGFDPSSLNCIRCRFLRAHDQLANGRVVTVVSGGVAVRVATALRVLESVGTTEHAADATRCCERNGESRHTGSRRPVVTTRDGVAADASLDRTDHVQRVVQRGHPSSERPTKYQGRVPAAQRKRRGISAAGQRTEWRTSAHSSRGRFGGDGAYLVVADDGDRAWARRIPLAEQFRIYTDSEGVLRTDHALDLWQIPALRLHYRLEATTPDA